MAKFSENYVFRASNGEVYVVDGTGGGESSARAFLVENCGEDDYELVNQFYYLAP